MAVKSFPPLYRIDPNKITNGIPVPGALTPLRTSLLQGFWELVTETRESTSAFGFECNPPSFSQAESCKTTQNSTQSP